MEQGVVDQIMNGIEWAFLSILGWIIDGLKAVYLAIPSPDFLEDSGNLFSGIGSSVMFFADVVQLGFGLTVLASAYTARFIVRRLPFIG